MGQAGENSAELAKLLKRHEGSVAALIRDEAGVTLLRFDSAEDLLQGVLQEALRSAGALEWRGEEAFRGWLFTIARRHLSGRRDYWFACKRTPGALLRLTLSSAGDRHLERKELADSAAGPATFAFRREQLVLATKALAMLLPRDREIVTWMADGAGAGEVAQRLGISPDAAEKARSRAVERLRKAFELLMQRRRAEDVGETAR